MGFFDNAQEVLDRGVSAVASAASKARSSSTGSSCTRGNTTGSAPYSMRRCLHMRLFVSTF